jgi:hypothetical protein
MLFACADSGEIIVLRAGSAERGMGAGAPAVRLTGGAAAGGYFTSQVSTKSEAEA